MPTEIIESISFNTLVKRIQNEINEGRRELTVRRWNIGRDIKEYILHGEDRARYGKNIFKTLSKRLKLSTRLLHLTVQLYETYPKYPKIVQAPAQLTFTDLSTLVTVSDRKKRQKLERKIIRQNLTSRQLKAVVVQKNAQKKFSAGLPAQPVKLPLERGKLYTYKIIHPTSVNVPEGMAAVDCGFKNWRAIAPVPGLRLAEGDTIESRKTAAGYQIKKTDNTKKDLFTFKANLERIVDADTFWFQVDLGFDWWSLQDLRLRGIDCPEINTPAGKRAKRFVEKELKPCTFVVIKTYASDKYARYLTDIFYLPGETDVQKVADEGIFLNQRLLDLGLAKVWR